MQTKTTIAFAIAKTIKKASRTPRTYLGSPNLNVSIPNAYAPTRGFDKAKNQQILIVKT